MFVATDRFLCELDYPMQGQEFPSCPQEILWLKPAEGKFLKV